MEAEAGAAAADAGDAEAEMILQWHITERCNLACAHCYQDGRPMPELGYGDMLDVFNLFHDFMMARRNGPDTWGDRAQITLTGGEPFVRDDFMVLLERFASERSWVSCAILTNGSLIDDAAARNLRRIKPEYVQVSVEGSEATHDRIRGRGNWRRTVEAIKLLVKNEIHTLIGFTAHRRNFREFTDVAELGSRLGVARVWADRLVPLGSGAAMQTLRPDETREFVEGMRAAAKKFSTKRTEIAMHRALQFRAGGGRPYHCTAGDTLLALMPNGDVYPCRRMPIRVGNVREQPIGDIYEKHDLLIELRERRRPCAGCESCIYAGVCRGGLHCLAHAVGGDPFTRDPGCWGATANGDETAESNAHQIKG